MRILALYVAREFLKLFAFLVVAFVSIFTLFDFIEKVDNFNEAGVPTSTMMSYFLLQVPEITSLMVPMAVLMATIITLGLMSKKNEILAIKSSGLSLMRYTLPIVLSALALALSVALINETILPGTKSRTNYIWEVLVEKRPAGLYHKEKFWYKGQGSIYQVGFYDPGSQTLSDVVYHRFDKDFNLVERVDGRRARYLGGKWVFFEGLRQRLMPDGGYSGEAFDEKAIALPERPTDFSRLAKPSEEMSLAELGRYLEKIEQEGYDSRRQRVDLQAKLSFPFVCLIMALLGIPLALMKERGQFLAPAVVIGLGLALLYWVGFSYSKSVFGYSGVLPPVLAAWLPNAVFALGGLGLMTSIRQ